MTNRSPWSNVYGVARSLMAVSTLSTLLLHSADQIFRPLGRDIASARNDPFIDNLSLFSLVGADHLELGRWFAIGLLCLVISGWRPRITGVLHWWVSFSFAATTFLIEGGDQVIANMTLLLVPITLGDARRWHWSRDVRDLDNTWTQMLALVAGSAFAVMRLQVAVIYLEAAVEKMRVPQWANGTAIYYWFLHPDFGVVDSVRPIVTTLLANAYIVTALTWGVIGFELVLFTGVLIERRYRQPLLVAGLVFHFGILLVHGLASFFFAMAAALILYLRRADEPFQPGRMARSLRDFALHRRRLMSTVPIGASSVASSVPARATIVPLGRR